MSFRRCILAAAWALAPLSLMAAPPAVRPVSRVEVQRWVGTWYEVARLPNRFQADCASDVTAHYEPKPDGTLQVTNSCRTPTGRLETAVGTAWRQPGMASGNAAKLTVSFLPRWLQWLPLGRGDYWVVMLDPDYRFAVVSEPTRHMLWVLSRSPTLPAEQLGRIVDRLADEGYPTGRLVLTRQSAVVRETGSDQTGPTAARPRLMVLLSRRRTIA
jgi:apolipoprotein D and lipocalin family protein